MAKVGSIFLQRVMSLRASATLSILKLASALQAYSLDCKDAFLLGQNSRENEKHWQARDKFSASSASWPRADHFSGSSWQNHKEYA